MNDEANEEAPEEPIEKESPAEVEQEQTMQNALFN